jgi:hypothetical protein
MSHKVRLPAEVRRSLQLARGERVLAAALLAERPVGEAASYLVATDRAVYWPDDEGHQRAAWDRMAAASWQDDVSTMTLVPSGAPPIPFVVTEPGRLPETVRERVTASIVVSRHVPLIGRSGVRITARRPTDEGEIDDPQRLAETLRWEMAFDAGVDPEDPDVREAADTALAQIKHEIGG